MKIEIVSEYQSVGFSQLSGLCACWTLSFDEILPPHLCTMCFITFMDSSKAN